MIMYGLALNEKSMPKDWRIVNKLETVRRCGFDILEICIDESEEKLYRLDWDNARRRVLRRDMEQVGLRIVSVHLTATKKYALGSHDPELRKQGLALAERALHFAVDVGIPLIQLAGCDVYYEDSDEETAKRFGENLNTLVQIGARSGVLFGLEPLDKPFMNTVEKAMYWVKQIKNPYLGIYPDIGSLSASLEDSAAVTEDLYKGSGHLFAVHLQDNAVTTGEAHRYAMSEADFERCLGTLWDMGVRRYTAVVPTEGVEKPQLALTASSEQIRRHIKAVSNGMDVI